MTDSARALLARTRDNYGACDGRDPALLLAALEEVEAAYGAMARRAPSPVDAETCRLAMLMAVSAGAQAEGDVWRARCLARAAAVGWHSCVGSLLVSEAFRALSRENDNYRAGRTLDVLRASATAERILDEVEVILRAAGDGGDPDLGHTAPTVAILRRFLHEKRGLLLLVAGRLDDARESYRAAADAVGGQTRGRIKVALGRALVDYAEALRDREDPTDACVATERLGREAAEAGLLDIAGTARLNAAAMAAAERRLVPYEIL